MVVNRQVDPVFLTEIIQRLKRVQRRLGDQVLDSHLLGKIKGLAVGVLVPFYRRVVIGHTHAQILQVLLHLAPLGGGQAFTRLEIRLLLAQWQEERRLNPEHAHPRQNVQRFIEAAVPEGVSQATDTPAKLLRVGRAELGRLAGRLFRRPGQKVQREDRAGRSEERRVGKEGRSRWSPYP